jgi:gliding motility-associated-like protein
MRNFYPGIFILLFTSSLYSQVKPVNIRAVKLPDAHYQFVNKITGIKASDLVWDEVESFVNGFAKVSANHKWGFIDQYGKLVTSVNFESVRNYTNKLAAARQQFKWGFINETGNTVIPFIYDIVYDFKERVTAAYKDNKWFLIDKKGTTIKQLEADVFWGFKNGSARFTRNGRSGIMNTKGDIVSMEPEKTASNKIKAGILRTNASQSGTCPANIDFEYGNFTNWTCFTGVVITPGNNTNAIIVNPSPPTVNRHEIIPASTPSLIDPYGLFPINPPDGSGYAVKLGNDINGAEAERISYQINVPSNSVDASITYRYAVVLQDPGHPAYQQPRFSAKLLDVLTGTYLPCATYEYISTSVIPGFNDSPLNDSIKYKNWASVYINLSHYAGQSLILEFTTEDCAPGGHWGYAYIDVGDCNISANVEYHCSPNQAIFTAPPGFQYYNWWNSTFSTLLGTGENMTLTSPPAPGTMVHVEVIPYNGFGCSDTLDVPLTLNIPAANAGPDKPFCIGTTASIGSAPVSGMSYSWSPANFLSNPAIASPIANPPVSTSYAVTVTNNSTGCFAVDTVNVTVNPKPIPGFNPGPAQCLAGNSFTFTNTSTISAGSLSYAWNFGDGSSSTQVNPVHSYANAGTYSVKLIVTSNSGCKDSIVHNAVTVNSNPVVKTSNDASICRGNSVQLQTTGALSYTWTPASNLSCSDCSNPIAAPLTSVNYIVKGIDIAGCPGYDTVAITVFQPIGIGVSPDKAICSGQSINLLASGDAASYIWSPAQSLSSTTITNPIATPAATTQYRVIGYDGHNCFTDTGFVTITVNPSPSIELGPDLTLSTGTVYPFTPMPQNGPIVSWLWSPSTNLSCTACPDPLATIKKDMKYYVLIKNTYGCTATDSIRIKTFCEGSQVFIPNAFTPDGDGLNDVLMVRAKGIESVRSFRIFTRWGELIFEKTNFSPNDPAYGWDGKIKGVTGAAEVYVYTAEVTCDNLQTFVFKGNTAILK